MNSMESNNMTILIPCLNEEQGIARVIQELRQELPDARIWIIDNNCTDKTSEIALQSGADEILFEPRPGKARAVLTALERVDSELVMLIDGDASYPAKGALLLMESYQATAADMIVGVRTPSDRNDSQFRPLHPAGTRLFAVLISIFLGHQTRDVFSGIRLLSKRFYKNVAILSHGFELELELTVECLDKGFCYREVPVPFRERALGSHSKLKTFRDGIRILRFLLVLFRDYRPLLCFTAISLVLLLGGLVAGAYPIVQYVKTGLVHRVPLAVLAAAMVVLAALCFLTGVTLESGLRHHRESFQARIRSFNGKA